MRPRRPGKLGVHSLDHFDLIVPGLKQAERLCARLGPDVREEGNELGLYTFGNDHRWGRAGEGAARKLTYVSFCAYPEDIERLQRLDVAQPAPPAGFEGNGIWFRDPGGTLVEVRVAEKPPPTQEAVQHNPSAPPGLQGSHARSRAPFVQPRRLAHILPSSGDALRSIEFHHRVSGLRPSDRSGAWPVPQS